MFEKQDNKNYKIQKLRGIAIIAVILIHTLPSDLWGGGRSSTS